MRWLWLMLGKEKCLSKTTEVVIGPSQNSVVSLLRCCIRKKAQEITILLWISWLCLRSADPHNIFLKPKLGGDNVSVEQCPLAVLSGIIYPKQRHLVLFEDFLLTVSHYCIFYHFFTGKYYICLIEQSEPLFSDYPSLPWTMNIWEISWR